MRKQDRLDRVLECLLTSGPLTARDLAKRIYGDGDTRTPGRTAIHIALGELERHGKISRKRPDKYAKGKGDLWRVITPPTPPA